jgi:steroid 5-alpha reductase family enzyme
MLLDAFRSVTPRSVAEKALADAKSVRFFVMSHVVVEHRPWAGFAVVALAYGAALIVATGLVQILPNEWHPLSTLAVADVAATLTVFVFSYANNNTSVYDPYWSVAPPVIAVWLASGPGHAREFDVRQVAVMVLSSLYGLRLTWNWARGWKGLSHEDWRYVRYRSLGKWYWLMSLFGLHLFPTVFVFLGCLPLQAALVAPTAKPFGGLDLVACIVTAAAILIETVADEQLRAFRLESTTSGAICTRGLWRYSRHPNYFGEILFWFGLWLFGVANGATWWAAAGWLSILGLFVGISIPMAERRSLERRPAFADHQRRVPALIPWFRPRASSAPRDQTPLL